MENNNKHISKGEKFLDTALLGAVLDNAPDCIFILDTFGQIRWINRQGAALFDAASPENLIGKSHEVLWSEVGLDEAVEGFQNAADGREARFSSEFRRLNGTPRHCDVIYKPLQNNSNEVEHILGSARPVSAEVEKKYIKHYSKKLHAITKELKKKNESLHQLDKMKSDFLNSISHELGTPLTSLRWAADNIAILLKDRDNADINKLLSIIREDSDRLGSLVGHLLDFSRIEAGKVTLRRKVTQLGPIIQNCIDKFNRRIKDKMLDIEIDVSPALPAVWVDRLKIANVLKNLIENSIKYTDAGGMIRIEATNGQHNHMVQVSVQDNGIGIPKEDINKVFDKFFCSEESSANSSGGTGLGLAIAKSFVEQHVGKIWCESVVAQGTTLYFTLPIAKRNGAE